MREYYTRPCNFYYGNHAKKVIKNKKALSLAGNPNIAFDQIEVFQRKKRGVTKSKIYSFKQLNKLKKKIKLVVKADLKKITSKRPNISRIEFKKPNIMGILNVTPDSFSDGGLFFKKSKAYDQAQLMIASGASIIDIGGESTRPGSKIVQEKDEWSRVENIIKTFKRNFSKTPLSLDTRKAYVMKKGIDCGVNIINDVSGLNFDKKSFDVIKSKKIPFILHHMQGTPNTMQKNPKYDDALLDVYDFFEKKINLCIKKKN